MRSLGAKITIHYSKEKTDLMTYVWHTLNTEEVNSTLFQSIYSYNLLSFYYEIR